MGKYIWEGGKQFYLTECPSCQTEHAIEMVLYNAAQQRRGPNGLQIYCPNGHEWHLTTGDSAIDRVRQERDRLKQQLAYKDDEISRQKQRRERAERSASAYRGQVTKLKNRSKAGLCPCCNRTFQNLRRHMETKHPNMDPAEPLQVIEGGKG